MYVIFFQDRCVTRRNGKKLFILIFVLHILSFRDIFVTFGTFRKYKKVRKMFSCHSVIFSVSGYF